MKSARHVAAALAIAGAVMHVAGPLWAVIDSGIGRNEGNFGLGDGTVHGEWQPGQIILMVAGALLCVGAVTAAHVSGRGRLDE